MPDNNRISTEVILPETITEVGNYEFYSCRSLQQVELPKGLVSIAADAFYSIPDITMLVYENSYGHLWCIENNVAFKIIGTSIVPSESAWTLPPSLRAIAEEAFLGSLGAAVSFRFVFIQSFFALQSVVLQNLRNFFNP